MHLTAFFTEGANKINYLCAMGLVIVSGLFGKSCLRALWYLKTSVGGRYEEFEKLSKRETAVKVYLYIYIYI